MKTKGENYLLELRISNSEKLENREYKSLWPTYKIFLSSPHYNLLENKFTHVTVCLNKVSCRYFVIFTEKKSQRYQCLLKEPRNPNNGAHKVN